MFGSRRPKRKLLIIPLLRFSHGVSFEDQVLVIREKLAELYESEQQWSRAAQMLSGMDLDSTMRVIDDTLRLSKCVQIARLYLEDDDAVNAEAFINKASFLVSNSQHEVLNLQYKVCYARILDLKRKFLEAALRYYDISHIEKLQIGDELIDEEALEQALSAVVSCTILVAAVESPRVSLLRIVMAQDLLGVASSASVDGSIHTANRPLVLKTSASEAQNRNFHVANGPLVRKATKG
ncbi:hypothetical protein VitviT2T_001094 [Vitis vinifera]|uniref:PSMD12/CSN4-like N-terminal domain-containing protein n=1 Tax=Vitis vinifera TaxID=29760 RepID=A0ABY9BEJ4_VITVI|nr:hypothetical protein VitviT2T_001094 [Vitis vinifera]